MIGFEALARSIRITGHQYDYTKANAAPVDTYDKKDPKLIDQVVLTRKALQLSVVANALQKGNSGVELSSSNLILPDYVNDEIASLKSLVSDQLRYLGISRDYAFSLSQNESGEILVAGENERLSADIQESLNSSDHFRKTFHLLKTAENVMSVYGSSDNFAERQYRLDVTSEALTGNVTILKKGEVDDYTTTAQISDTEAYYLARYGSSARLMSYQMLKI